MEFSHVDQHGNARMVDVSEKKETLRTAEAYAEVHLGKDVFAKVQQQQVAKGDVLSVARVAGIQAAKKTFELIPLCHNIVISHVEIDFALKETTSVVEITSRAKTTSSTGVEMEALTAVSIAALTIYDMCKALSKSITIMNVQLVSKTGGKSKDYHR